MSLVFACCQRLAKLSKGIQRDELSIYPQAKFKHFVFNFFYLTPNFIFGGLY